MIDEADPEPDDGVRFTDGDDDPSLPNAEEGGGRGPEWPYPAICKRCTAPSRRRTKAAREAGLIGEDEVRRCRSVCVRESDKCRYHGGITRRKSEVAVKWGPVMSTGRFSKRLGKFAKAYEIALNSPNLLDLREGIAVLDACVQRVMERSSALDTPEFRKRAIELYKSGDFDDLGKLLHRGGNEDQSIEMLIRSVEALQKRIEEAWKIKLTKDDTLNTRDLIGILGRVVDIVFDQVGGEEGARVVEQIDMLIRGFGSRKSSPRAFADEK